MPNDNRPPLADITTSDALDDYYREHVALKVADKKRQEDAIAHLKLYFRYTPLSEIDIPASRHYADARREGKIGGGVRCHNKCGSDSTIRRELGALRAAANHAKRWRRIEKMPSIELPRENLSGPDEEAPYFTIEEITKLFSLAELNALDGGRIETELPWWLNLAYYTGARRRSIEDLERSQVRVDQRRIVLQKPGKTGTKKRQPIVPIFKPMEPVIDEMLRSGGQPKFFRTSDFYRPFRALCEQAGFSNRHHPHLLRHSRATHLLQAGKSLYDVARLLGDTVATVERVYGHHSTERIGLNLEE